LFSLDKLQQKPRTLNKFILYVECWVEHNQLIFFEVAELFPDVFDVGLAVLIAVLIALGVQ
jgi:hypothetical protein